MPTSLHRRFWRLTLINIASNVTVPLAGLVDTAMLGHLSEIRFLAGVALGSVLFDYVYWSFGFLRMGTTGTTAQAVGRGDTEQGYLVLYRSLALALGLAAALLLLQWPLREAGFALLAGEPAVESAGRDYFDARIWGAPATLCNFALIGWYLGREQSRHVLAMAVAANLANIGFNYLFIIRLGLAARGAGLATMVSQYVMFAVALGIFFRGGGRVAWNWSAVLDRRRLGELCRLNLDILIRTLCLVSSFAVFTNVSSTLGTTVLAANTILLRLFYLVAYLIDGAAFASESLAGHLLGRGDRAGMRGLVRLALGAGVGFAALCLALFFLVPRATLGLLTSHGEVVATSLRYAPWLVPVLLLGALAFMYDGVFLGLSAGRALRNAMILSTFAVFLPLAGVALATGSNGWLWAAMTAFMLARAATLGRASRALLKRRPALGA